jgi:putative peptidoglycan lipid II flippase
MITKIKPLSRFIGLGGLALATSISALFCTFLLFISLRKKIGPFGLLEITRSFVKIVVASLVMGLLAKWVYEVLLLYLSANISLLLAIAIGAGIYFVLIYFMKIKEVEEIIRLAKQEFKKLTA